MIIYTDGSDRGDDVGGWAYVTTDGVEKSGKLENSTNNRAEMYAVLMALKDFPDYNLTIITDSMLVVNCFSGKWRRKKNKDLWKELLSAAKGRDVDICWVKGHSTNLYNCRADELARAQTGNSPVDKSYVYVVESGSEKVAYVKEPSDYSYRVEIKYD